MSEERPAGNLQGSKSERKDRNPTGKEAEGGEKTPELASKCGVGDGFLFLSFQNHSDVAL